MNHQDFKTADWMKAYRPFFFENISDLVDIQNNKVLLCDKSRGMLTEVDLDSETATFKKRYDVNDYIVDSICYYDGYIYSVYRNNIYVADYYTEDEMLKNELLVSIPDCSNLTGISVTKKKIYLVTENQSILSYDRETKEVETIGKSPGIGADDLCYFKDQLFIVDAKEAVKNLRENEKNNVLAKAKTIRDYIYEKLTYVMDRYHEGTEDVLRNGEGSCGEYLNVFLSLLRLNNIPARKCGQYKVPAYKMQAGSRSACLSPDFNHVWLQFYVPGLGWVPLESSADDEASSFREWAQRYFMALSWYHAECRMGSYFEDVFEQGTDRAFFLSAGDMSVKDIKFRVIGELDFN